MTRTKSIYLALAALLVAPLAANAGLIEIYDADAPMATLADAQAVVDAAAGPDASASTSAIWFSDSGTNAYGFGVGAAFPGGYDTTFVAVISGLINTDWYEYLWLAHDDGVELSVDGAVLYEFGTPTDFRASGALYLGAAAGLQSLSGLYYENFGEADLFLLGYRRDGGGWEIASVPEPGTLALLSLGLLGLGATRRRREV